MWLLRLHIAISILCLLTADGFLIICKEIIKENGWVSEKKNGFFKRIINHWMYFIPLMNLICVAATFMICTVKKEKWKEFTDKYKESRDDQKE